MIVGVFLLLALPLQADVIDDLLAMPPAPRVQVTDPKKAHDNPPDVSAPVEELARYWARFVPDRLPPPAVRERLVETIERQPRYVENLVQAFPPRADVCRRLAGFEEAGQVAEWMLHHCASHRARLVAAAGKVKDAEGYVSGGDELEALARADWTKAEPLLKRLAASPEPRTRALALALRYEHAPDAAGRVALESIAGDASAPGAARARAFEALGKVAGDGFEDWLVARMRDASLAGLKDGHYTLSPVEDVVEHDPDQWIPVMTRLLSSNNRTVRSLAASALGRFHLEKARADAIAPLIPWISQPDWAEDFSSTRLSVVLSVVRLGLRDAIPHLVRAVANDHEGDGIRSSAAEALAEFGGGIGRKAMFAALQGMRGGRDRASVAGALVRSGGLTPAERARGLEAFASVGVRGLDGKDLGKPGSTDAVIGLYISKEMHDDEEVAALVAARVQELEATQPKLAESLVAAVQWWTSPSARTLRMRSIENGSADATLLAAALMRRYGGPDRAALGRLEAAGGMRAGIAAVISGETGKVLAGSDRDAQRALLAGSRLIGEPLPLEAVGKLFGHSPQLDAAAEAWLIAEDSARARAMVQRRHPGELLILGLRPHSEPGSGVFTAFATWEQGLLGRFKASKADELIALFAAGTWIKPVAIAELTIHGKTATLSSEGRRVPLDPAALADLRTFLTATRFDDLRSLLNDGAYDGVQYEYVHLTRTGGRRVFMNNPGFGPEVYVKLVQKIEALAR